MKVDIAPTEFGDTAAIDLFVLADYPGNLALAGNLELSPPLHTNIPKLVWDHFFQHWIAPSGVPRRLIYDQGREFEREC